MTEMAKALSKEMEKNEQLEKQLTKAKEIIREFLNYNSNSDWSIMSKKAEQFLKGNE